MGREDALTNWVLWQFLEVPGFLFKVWNNYIMFAANFFSIGLLFKTFFDPWRRYNWVYPKGFDAVGFFNTLISNIVSRILGALMRALLIITGILFQIFVGLAGLVVFIFWLLIPFIIIAGFLFAFSI